MGNTNNSLRIRTNVGEDKFITFNLDSEYDTLEILSLKINQRGAYRYHTSTYGVVVGRVLANNGFGVPNAKLSLFIAKDENADVIENAIYPYTTVGSKNNDGIRYNLLPSNRKDDCHQVVGTFPSKRMILDDNSVLEVFDKYYVYTTRTNEAGDYMFFGIPTGTYNLHMDLDISDCGKLSQRPRDFIYKGYSLDQFQSANQFKIDTELSSLSQIFTQDTSIEVKPFWGDEDEGTNIGITREDINVNYTFEPTCVFMGSIVSDNPNEGISKRCIPTNKMGDMREMVTGSGTIEILRKKIDNTIEELEIKGTQLIDGNGVWCFQIPMNLDYVMTDEYGNIVPTDNPEKGIPTRCEVRFRISMDETQSEGIPYKRGKVLVPNNPENGKDVDYEFGSKTKDSSFKSLMWNNVYSVKSFIPRFQKARNIKTNKFTGIKNVNINGGNNPMPYNNIRIKIPFMFWAICNVVKLFIRIIQVINKLKVALMSATLDLVNLPYAYISNELCPDLEYWYFAPGMHTDAPHYTWWKKAWDWLTFWDNKKSVCDEWENESVCKTFKEIYSDIKNDEGLGSDDTTLYYFFLKPYETEHGPTILSTQEFEKQIPNNTGTARDLSKETMETIVESVKNLKSQIAKYYERQNWFKCDVSIAKYLNKDGMSTEALNAIKDNDPRVHLTPDVDYLMQCVEMALAQEYEVIKFDFYNDWINGTIYLPRWARDVRYKRKRSNGKKVIIEKVKGCINDERSKVSRRYMQQCSLQYDSNMNISGMTNGCGNGDNLRCHKKQGSEYTSIFGRNGGAVQEQLTMLGDYVYYMKPKEGNVPLFATDIIMLGTLFDCNEYGLPSTFESLMSTTYKMPMNMALTNTENDSYSYFDADENTIEKKEGEYTDSDIDKQITAPRLSSIKDWDCGKVCSLNYVSLSGATPAIPSYQEVENMLDEYENAGYKVSGESDIVIEYEDIFPITEMSGIEWGYTGPGQGEPNGDKMYAPGGHFMGLACGNAETNIRSCVNLKRACEIGTTLSEHFSIPIGYKDFENGNFYNVKEEEEYDVVNYLYVSPNGLISKDQVIDVTFRSAFATMNQNSLETITDPVTRHKKYKFEHLIPDSFDGCLQNRISGDTELNKRYNQRIPQEWDGYWDEYDADKDFAEFFKNDVILEHGYTINRLFETKSDDYIKFRHGSLTPKFLKGDGEGKSSMPIYRNSFYFYFGLKQGLTALDEFRRQFFAPCAKSVLVGNESNILYKEIIIGGKFEYDVEVTIKNMSPVFSYILTRADDSKEKVNVGNFEGEDITTDNFIIKNVPIGRYYLKVIDGMGTETGTEVVVGVNNYSIDVNLTSVKNYVNKVDYTDFAKNQTNGGTIDGTFELNFHVPGLEEYYYDVKIRKDNNVLVVNSTEWDELYDSDLSKLWLFGPGTYKVYVCVTAPDGYDEYLYCTFEIKDGVAPAQIYLSDASATYTFGYDVLKTIQNNPPWSGPASLMNDFSWYKSLVNPNNFGTPFQLGLGYTGGTANMFSPIFGGKGEKIKGSDFEIKNEVVLSDSVEKGYNLSQSIIVGSNMSNRGYFYYTAYNGNNQIFASDYVTGKVANGDGVEILDDKVLPKVKGYFCLVSVNGKQILYGEVNGSYIRFEKRLDLADGVDVIVADMVSLPVYVYPFASRTIMGMFYNEHNKLANNVRYLTGTTGTANYNQCFQNLFDVSCGDYEVSTDEKTLTVYEHCPDNLYPRNFLVKQEFTIPKFSGVLKYTHRAGDSEIGFRIFNLNENLDSNKTYYYLTTEETIGDILQLTGFTNNDGVEYNAVKLALDGDNKMTIDENNGEQYAENSMNPKDAVNVWAYGMTHESHGEKSEECQFNNYKENIFVHTFASFESSNLGKFNFVTNTTVFSGGTTVKHNYSDGKKEEKDGKTTFTYKLYKWNGDKNTGTVTELAPETGKDNKYIFTQLKLVNNENIKPKLIVKPDSDKYRYGIIQEYVGDVEQTKTNWPSELKYDEFKTHYFVKDENEVDSPKIVFEYGGGLKWDSLTIDPNDTIKQEDLDKIAGSFYPVIVAYTGETFSPSAIIKDALFNKNPEMILTWKEIEKVNFQIIYVYEYRGFKDDGSGSTSGGGNDGGGGSNTETMIITVLISPKGNAEGVCNVLNISASFKSSLAPNGVLLTVWYDSDKIADITIKDGEDIIQSLENPILGFNKDKIRVSNDEYEVSYKVFELDVTVPEEPEPEEPTDPEPEEPTDPETPEDGGGGDEETPIAITILPKGKEEGVCSIMDVTRNGGTDEMLRLIILYDGVEITGTQVADGGMTEIVLLNPIDNFDGNKVSVTSEYNISLTVLPFELSSIETPEGDGTTTE